MKIPGVLKKILWACGGVVVAVVGLIVYDQLTSDESYEVKSDEIVILRDLLNRNFSVHRYPGTVTYDSRWEVLHTHKTRGVVELTNDSSKTMHAGSCDWSVVGRFADGETAAICGDVSYELVGSDRDLILLDVAGGEERIKEIVKLSLTLGMTLCAATVDFEEVVTSHDEEFFACVQKNAEKAIQFVAFTGVNFVTFRLTGLERASDMRDFTGRLPSEKVLPTRRGKVTYM